jgi:hypothetical protein
MILADSFAWIEYLRGAGGPIAARMRDLVGRPDLLVTTEPVVMELMAGARDLPARRALTGLLAACTLVRVRGLADYQLAALVYSRCSARGESVGSMIDCLIATVAIRANAEVLAQDRDFAKIARHTPLRVGPSP